MNVNKRIIKITRDTEYLIPKEIYMTIPFQSHKDINSVGVLKISEEVFYTWLKWFSRIRNVKKLYENRVCHLNGPTI